MLKRLYINIKKELIFISNFNNLSISSLLILILPALLLRHETLAFISLLLLGIFGFCEAIKNKEFIFNIPNIRYVFLIFYSLLLSIMISSFLHYGRIDIYKITRQEVLLGLSPLIAYSVLTAKINHKRLILYIKLTLVLVGVYVIFKNFSQIETTQRVLWPSWIGALLFAFTLISVSNKRKGIYSYVIDFIYYFLAIFSIFECSSRSAILALIFLIPIAFFFNIHFSAKKNKNANLIDFLIISLTLLLCLYSSQNTQSRLREAKSSISEQIFHSSNKKKINIASTIDQRIILFKSGFKVFLEKPIFGQGYHNTNKSLNKFYPQEIKETYMVNMQHVHNSFLNMLVQGGIFGLIIYLFFFYIFPFNIFLKALRRDKRNYYAMIGLILILAYGLLGIADTMYLGIFQTSFFIFFIAYSLRKSSN
jgi:O-antigen ligase